MADLLTIDVFKTTVAGMNDVEPVSLPRRAAALLAHPLRPRILAHAREPVSATELARRLGQPRQRVNYHVRQLARTGFLEPAGQQRKRNMVEQQYVASAAAYVVTPGVLGEAAPPRDAHTERAGAAELLALCAHAQSDVASLMESGRAAGLRVRALALQHEIRFDSAEQRAAFTKELVAAVDDVVRRYVADSSRGAGRPFRLVLGCYPVPTAGS
jgi:hypothetical protein